MSSDKPLSGIKVVDLTTFAAAPICCRMLGDWGADVIKIEPPSGDAWRYSGPLLSTPSTDEENPNFEIENVNKRFISLDLKSPQGVEIINKLLEQADVFVTNTRLESLKKLELTYEDLREKYPKLIWAHISGFGDKGPDVKRPGFDLVAYWARSGALIDLSQPGSVPITAPAAFGDHPTGSTLAAGICAALVKQQKTGKGDKVTISLYGTAIWNLGLLITSTQERYKDQWPKSRKVPISPLTGTYKCQDGQWLLLSIIEVERYWTILCKVINREDLINDTRFNNAKGIKQNSEACVDILDAVFITKKRAEWEDLLAKADLAYEKVIHFKDVSKDEQAWANEYLYERTFQDGGKIAMPANPINFCSMGRPDTKKFGRVGEDTREVLLELGYSGETIDNYIERKVIIAR